MSQGNGAFGETNSASGSIGAQYGASPIRSLPSAPSPCSRITSFAAFAPLAGGCVGPESWVLIMAMPRARIVGTGIADRGGWCHAAAGCVEEGGSLLYVENVDENDARVDRLDDELVLAGLHMHG